MVLSYIELDDVQKRKPKKEDVVSLYDSNLIEVNGDPSANITPYKTAEKYSIEGNIITDEGINKDYILIKLASGVNILKTHIDNIRQIFTEDNTNDELQGNLRKINTSSELIDIFTNTNFPHHQIDEIFEREDQELIKLYCGNIKIHYNIPELETELRTFQNIKEYGGISNTINSYQFNNIIQVLTDSNCFYKLHEKPLESLDILISPQISNLRFTLEGRDSIIKYCSSNIIPKTKKVKAIFKDEYKFKLSADTLSPFESYYKGNFPHKKRDFEKGVFNLYSLRTKLGGKLEIPFELSENKKKWVLNREKISTEGTIIDSLKKAERAINSFNKLERERGHTYLKIFRLKSRTTFIYNSVIRIDLTKVKNSKKEVVLQKFSSDVTMAPKYTFIDSDIANQDEQYEVEIELLNTQGLDLGEMISHTKTAINIIKYLNAIINERPGFTHSNLKDQVLITYKKQIDKLIKKRIVEVSGKHNKRYFNYYISPKVKSLNIEEVQPASEENLEPGTEKSIRKEYCVTEKADGLANMLFAYSSEDLPNLNGYLFFIDANLQIYNTYLQIPSDEQWQFTSNSGTNKDDDTEDTSKVFLLNGEFLNFDKIRNKMNKFGIYDTYIYAGEDKCRIPLLGNNINTTVAIPKDRISLANKFINILKTINTSVFSSSLKWLIVENFCKKFHIPDGSEDIFTKSKRIWVNKKTFEYKLDGLIYTPISEDVGFTSKGTKYLINPGTTWHRNLKWKPGEESTIDFLIKFKKYKSKSYSKSTIFKNVIRSKMSSKDKYYVIEFYTTGKKDGKMKPVRFLPPNYSEDECVGLFKLNQNDKIIDQEENEVKDNTIVEVSFYPNEIDRYNQFKILRTRHDKTYQYKSLVNYQQDMFKKVQKAIYLKKQPNNTRIEKGFLDYMNRGFFNKIQGLREITSIFKDYDDIQTNKFKYNFGNSTHVANDIWKSIHTPITTEMITTGTNLPTLEDAGIYYKPTYTDRTKSLTINLQNYHNKYIKGEQLLKKVSKKIKRSRRSGISLLDLACGKGGDIYKWYSNRLSYCVGIDISEDNICNSKDGAWVRYSNLQQKSIRSVPTMDFQVLNTSKNLKENFPGIFTADTKFNIISIMFALHYFFKDKTTLDGLIKNIVENIEDGGYLIGACFNGSKIFEELSDVSTKEYKNSDDQVLLKIEKQYIPSDFADDETSLGKKINVTMYSIGTENIEYLVNFTYFKTILEEKGFTTIEITDFEDIEGKSKMTDIEKDMSNLNTLFIFKKKG